QDVVPVPCERVSWRPRCGVVAGRAGAIKVDLLADEVLLAHEGIVALSGARSEGPARAGPSRSGSIAFGSGVGAEPGLRARHREVLVHLHGHDAAVGLAHMRLVRRPGGVR